MRLAILFAVTLLVACGSATGSGGSCPTSLPADIGGVGTQCSRSGHLAEAVTTDRRQYTGSDSITITVTVRNDSSEGCAAPTACPPLPVVIQDAAGRQVWAPPQRGVCPAMARLLNPGESVSYPVVAQGLQLAAGAYSATGPGVATAAYGRAYFSVC